MQTRLTAVPQHSSIALPAGLTGARFAGPPRGAAPAPAATVGPIETLAPDTMELSP